MNILVNLLLIQFILVFITDYSGFPEDFIKNNLKKVFKIGEPSKIFTCSLCQTTWFGLLYLLITGHFTIPFIAFNFLLAALTPVTLDLVWLVRDFLTSLIGMIRYIIGIDNK